MILTIDVEKSFDINYKNAQKSKNIQKHSLLNKEYLHKTSGLNVFPLGSEAR